MNRETNSEKSSATAAKSSKAARGADYEIRSGGGSIVGDLEFDSKEQAEAVLQNFLTELLSASNRRPQHRGGTATA